MNRVILMLILSFAPSMVLSYSFGQEPASKRTFVFNTEEEAKQEWLSPAATYPLSNAEIDQRFRAIAEKYDWLKHVPSNLRTSHGKYNEYLENFGGVHFSGMKGKFDPPRQSTLTSLIWVVAINSQMRCGESIPIRISLKNVSSNEVEIGDIPVLGGFLLNSIKLIKKEDVDKLVKLTTKGAELYYLGWSGRGLLARVNNLKPEEEFELSLVPHIFDLTDYYDLSEPGEYELTFYTRRFIDDNGEPAQDQELEYPRKATVRFTVLPEHNGNESSVE